MKTGAISSNDMAVKVRGYDRPPGRQAPHSMHVVVQKAPDGPIVDSVADAIQRYLNIEPRREVEPDPNGEFDPAVAPQEFLAQGQIRDNALPWQLTINGVQYYMLQPEFHSWGGSLSAESVRPGLAGVMATPQQKPAGVKLPITTVGPPNFVDDPYFDPAYVAQNSMDRLRELLERPVANYVAVGPVPLSERAGQDPRYAYAVAINAMRRDEDFRLATHVLGGVA